MTGLRVAIAARTPLRGPFVAIPSPMVVEIMGGANPDFLCIDTEHSPIPDFLLTEMIRAGDLSGQPVLVRVQSALAQNITAALDAGATGILVPHVSSAQEAAAVVKAARFPPEGTRGAGPGRAAGYIRNIAGYIEDARRDTVVMVQIETVAAVARVAEILAVPGIDLALIGPGDLAVDLAARDETRSLDTLIDEVIAAGQAADLPIGIFSPDRDTSRTWLKRLSFVIEGSDALFLTLASDAASAPLD
ncbi:HpcH/HpaI aldolase family protein [Pseudooceanicola algae]|uniref:2-dehydro-3,6-dideoxy-6-sulfogluconate aldolase n=1 Tax=Pseudooceanicola algae TaxID=1537215 RepID=A0A418SL13_9RHOB|nr:aldolase/citrate lyase family protein [Pseudooceanicola algae]QPM90917.1 2-dehydro-3,6-dideoxy-6-sulfogluconate aldolase [Pseudooceanicola algae]